jgi:hypothetical protein
MRSAAILFLVTLTACATHPVTVQQAVPVHSSRILAPAQSFTEAPYTGRLVIKRDGGFMGSACTIRVFLDAMPIADLEPEEKVELFVPLGDHIVGATSTQKYCGGGVSEMAVVITAERQKILRIASGQSGDLFLQPSAF